jgi:RimJ/RimL family protein N-acetyltransferase
MYCSNNYCFRVIEEKDLEWARILHNSPEVLYMLTDTSFVNEKQQQKWFEKISLDNSSRRLIIEFNNERIGIARLDDIDYINNSICVGLDIHKKFRGKGHGFKSFKVLLKYCFDELNMNRVWLLVADFNTKAFNLYKKLGFKEEGRQRERLYRNGKYNDYIMMSIIHSEYNKKK